MGGETSWRSSSAGRCLWSIPAWAGKPQGVVPRGRRFVVYPPRGRGNLLGVTISRAHIGSIPAWAGKPGRDRPGYLRPTVYPRVGGETHVPDLPLTVVAGLSPRGRGNPGSPASSSAPGGSIPAWAGKPACCAPTKCRTTVYPRVGGETFVRRWRDDYREGLSPRGRGNPDHQAFRSRYRRSIPAWAGKPAGSGGSGSASRVYPRVGGET